jgi:hypothetical protein
MHKVHKAFNKSEFVDFHSREESLTHDFAPPIELHAIYSGAFQQANAKNGKTKALEILPTASSTPFLMS